MKRVGKLMVVSLFLAVILTGCKGNTEADSQGEGSQIQVVTTYSILHDIVRNIGGNLVEIQSLVPIGANPHEYDPLPLDIQKTEDADIVFYNGLNLEEGNSWFEKLIETAGKGGESAPVFKLSEGVEPLYLSSEGNEGEEDPHAWLDIRNGIKYAENARDALIKIDPEHAADYSENAEKYISKLESLHDEVIEKFSQIPKDKRFLVTSEGAFKYFGTAYDFHAGYIWEINAENQGTPDQVTQIVELIKEKNIHVLFVETSIDSRSMEMVSAETGVPIGGKLFTDSLGEEGEPGDSYIGMMEWNINMIFEQLMAKAE
ncbi:iron/zinc/copper transport system substrate-binding protein [Bacillus oleivorans]|uniref:Iron/zinc/copper transport system substrate-binding protein n=1 Tax=Bacillus oleivorans TaxID=1448271 RepID=A0A285CL02_9BACI|nr:metal ABC transporter substrate-binding protein [Bacillus oleivorans]SNX68232.1 iron/zinc/copper transport system substrate-binding protein [Bacillus oleivorans]